MSRITHFKAQPINIQYWDYYILCRLNTEATIALQRMEYWDGTKDAGISHAEDINDMETQAGKSPAQDTSSWIYKSQDELHWELMGIAGEKKVKDLFRTLEEDLGYLKVRNNPHKGWDRKKQYELEAGLIQSHVNYLGYIVSFFGLPLRRLRPIFYAIEALTRDNKIYIDALNVEQVVKKIASFKEDPKIPHFLKSDLEKLDGLLPDQLPRSFGNFAEWKAQNCGMQSAESRDAFRKTADSIPQKRGSNSIEDRTKKTNQRRQKEERKNGTSQQTPNVTAKQETHPSIHASSPSFSEVLFSPEEEMVYNLAKEKRISRLKRDGDHKQYCALLVQGGVITEEKLESLIQFCRQLPWLAGEHKYLYLKNLINELDAWLQMQHAPITVLSERKAGHVYSSYDDPDYVDDSFYPAKRKGAN